VLGAALAVPGAVVGSGVGASLAHPAEEVEAAMENLIIALADARPHEEVAWRISMVQLPNRLQVGEAEDSEWADYRDLADEGWDTVLEVEVVWFELFVEGDINPKISPKLILQGRLIRTRDNTELYRRKWLLWGEERNYFEAAADNARLFRQDLQQAYGALADRIIDDLFQSSLTEQDRPSREGEIVTLESAPPLAVSAKNRAQPSGAEATTESGSETAQQNLDGRWIARSGPWSGELRIAKGEYELEIWCESLQRIGGSVTGRVSSAGEISSATTGAQREKVSVSGAVHEMAVTNDRNTYCSPAVLKFERVN
jgi:hypothetical protein